MLEDRSNQDACMTMCRLFGESKRESMLESEEGIEMGDCRFEYIVVKYMVGRVLP